MKISYGITVYNEYKELDNLLYHLSKHIREEDEVIVTQDISKVGDKSIMQDDFYALEKILEKYEYGTYFKPRQLKVTAFEFRKDFSALKNYTKENCSGDYIFHIDADEIPNETLLKQLPQILEINENKGALPSIIKEQEEQINDLEEIYLIYAVKIKDPDINCSFLFSICLCAMFTG